MELWTKRGIKWTANTITLLVIFICLEVFIKCYAKTTYYKSTKLKSNCRAKSSFLWSIKRSASLESLEESPVSYFFGTIHVPYTRVWDSIPNRAKIAFQTSHNIFFELDLLNPLTASTLSKCQMLPKGVKLIDVLPSDLYLRLRRHLDYVRQKLPSWMTPDQRARGYYAQYLYNAITHNWQLKRPVWVMLMINSLTESDIKSKDIPVLDMYLAQEAQRLNKQIGSVERVEEQCIPLNGLNFSQVVFALNQTLYQHESIRLGILSSTLTTDDLIKHYNCGYLNELIFNYDTSQVPKIIRNKRTQDIELAKQIDNYFKSEIIIKRNKRMSERVVTILQTNPNQSFFFAFGTAHFLGNYSIFNYMKNSGFEINQVIDSRPKPR
ncbi:metalloprotease TIKI2-like [Oppia nitens]|uniref:metalloprotease TIKI2-like n=1 Tax=Oppia nitens TaxID=1686743 RepID=UPI0023DA0E4A|nr:metalloprotease TIKI2-like [Oppia nitens]